MDKTLNWDNTSRDYAQYRPGLPLSAFDRLKQIDIGLASQRVLDLGTGTGSSARQFSKQGCHVTGIDNSEQQIKQAKKLAIQEGLQTMFEVKDCNSMQYSVNCYDIVSAVQCWEYINTKNVCNKIATSLKKNGYLVIANFDEILTDNVIVQQTKNLINKYNPAWTISEKNMLTKLATHPSSDDFTLIKHINYTDKILYDKESWAGRVRASSATAATIPEEKISDFNRDLNKLMDDLKVINFFVCTFDI